jgi:hypothetical protein
MAVVNWDVLYWWTGSLAVVWTAGTWALYQILERRRAARRRMILKRRNLI